MNILNNAKNAILGKTIKNSEDKKHEEKQKTEMIEKQEKKIDTMDNMYKGKKFRDNEGNEYDAEEVMNAVSEHHKNQFDENILDMEGEYDINGNPWTGHHLIEYFKNMKNEEMETEEMGKQEMANKKDMEEIEELEEMEEGELDEAKTLEEIIENEKKNRSNATFPKSKGYFNIRKAKESFIRSNAENSVKAVVVETSASERMKSMFSPSKNNN